MVSVTGARANNGGARELFTEETHTVLVFPDGAVIRLAASVALGQLLFLTNQRNDTEVVCQVLNTRMSGPTGAYVELQFTDAKADFWGVLFSAAGKSEPEFSRKEQMEAQETTQAAPAAAVQPHKAEDVDQLKQEVEALRKQLRELEKQTGEEGGRAEIGPPASAMAKVLAGFVPPQAAPEAAEKKEVAARGMSGNDAPLMPAARETKEPARAVVGMSLPIGKTELGSAMQARDPSEDLLPKPELDFSQMPIEMVNGVRSAYRARHADIRKVLAPGLVVLALILGVVLWTSKPWRYLKFATKAAVTGKPSGAATGMVGASPTGGGSLGEKSTGAAETAGNNSESTSGSGTDHHDERGDSDSSDTGKNEAQNKNERGRARNEGAVALNTTADGNAGMLAVNDAPVLPAKLMKAANPVYPPDAMRSFITGDVRAEVVVEADGRIGEIKVLSGPQRLREAAVAALKQYQYAPATQGGKGVASKVTTTVKFWFNP